MCDMSTSAIDGTHPDLVQVSEDAYINPMRRLATLIAVALTAVACAGPITDSEDGTASLTPIDEVGFIQLTGHSERPMVVNLWASWCVPCRSEAPLFRTAALESGDEIRFVGIATEDAVQPAIDFISEFQLEFENYFDEMGEVQQHLGGIGLPMTVFMAARGDIVSIHHGIIDERSLALGIDELRRSR